MLTLWSVSCLCDVSSGCVSLRLCQCIPTGTFSLRSKPILICFLFFFVIRGYYGPFVSGQDDCNKDENEELVVTFILSYRCQNTRESQFEGGRKHKVDIFIVHKWDFLDKRTISKRCLPFVWPWCWPAFGMRGMHKPEPLQLDVDSLCLCTGQRLWDNNLRSVANSCFDTSTCAGAETTVCWKK